MVTLDSSLCALVYHYYYTIDIAMLASECELLFLLLLLVVYNLNYVIILYYSKKREENE